MSKESRKAYRNMEKVKNQSSEVIKFNESTQRLTNQSKIFPETLKFEFKFFLMSISTLLSTSIYINKQYLNNYNLIIHFIFFYHFFIIHYYKFLFFLLIVILNMKFHLKKL